MNKSKNKWSEEGFYPGDEDSFLRTESGNLSDSTSLETTPAESTSVSEVDPESNKRSSVLKGIGALAVILFLAASLAYFVYQLIGFPDTTNTVVSVQPIAELKIRSAEPASAVEDTPVVDTPHVVQQELSRQKPLIEPKRRQAPSPPVSESAERTDKSPSQESIRTTPPPTQSRGKEMYVVQVFSSPDRDDAQEQLELLRKKNISDGFVVEQKIRGQHWYRVRFGQYSSRDDAEEAAILNGFRSPWIARVR